MTTAVAEPLKVKKEAADFLKISTRSLDRLVAAGKVKAVYLTPNAVRFDVRDLVAYVDSLRGVR